ncbi:MAG: FHA domain-containing protein [Muribaculum sp.]|nr:FHA domain-containing protein [Muribaculum sp.]
MKKYRRKGYQVKGLAKMLSMLAVMLWAVLSFDGRAVAAGQDVLGMMFVYGEDDQFLTASVAVAAYMGEEGYCIFADLQTADEAAASYIFLGEKSHIAEFVGTSKELEASMFQMAADEADAKGLEFASPYEGQEVSLHYLCMNGESLEERTLPVVIDSYEASESFGYILHYSASDDAASVLRESEFYLPMAVVSADGYLVGVVMPNGDMNCFYLDESLFSGNHETPPEGDLFPNGGGSGGIKGREDTPVPAPTTEPAPVPTSTPAPEPTPAPTPTPAGNSINGIIVAAVIGVLVLIVVIVVILIFLFGKGKASPGQGTPAEPVIMPQPGGTPQPMDAAAQRPARAAQAVVLYLCCEGGEMDGKRFPITQNILLIGRDPACNICYPADTKGVSRRHCQVFWKSGVLMIMDLGSTAGTFIRGKGQIAANVPTAVKAGDTFYLGEKKNAFVIRMGE